MKKGDYEKFGKLWLEAHELSTSNQRPSNGAIAMAFDIFAHLSFENVSKAIFLHAAKSRFSPTPSDILAILEKSHPQHIGADEAWAICLRSMDEAETVIVTDEILLARTAAWDVWESGDKVGARMAFKAAYERFVSEGNPPKWKPSLGHDPDRRDVVINAAVEQGLLPETELLRLGVQKEKRVTLGQLALMSSFKAKEVAPDGNDKVFAELEALRAAVVGKREIEDT